MLRGPRLRAGRGVSTVPTRCQWSEAALGGCTEVVAPAPCLPAGNQPGRGSQGPRENPVCRCFSRGLIHPFPTCSCELADDSALKAGRHRRGLSPSLLLQAPARELRVTSHNIESTGGPLLSSASSFRPAFPRPPALGFKQPLPRKRCPSDSLSPRTQIGSQCLVTGLLELSGVKHQAPVSDLMALWGSRLIWCFVGGPIKGRRCGLGRPVLRSVFWH